MKYIILHYVLFNLFLMLLELLDWNRKHFKVLKVIKKNKTGDLPAAVSRHKKKTQEPMLNIG